MSIFIIVVVFFFCAHLIHSSGVLGLPCLIRLQVVNYS